MTAAKYTIDTGLDSLELTRDDLRDASRFRGIIAARKAEDASEGKLRDAVRGAREHGESWNVIGTALEMSRDEARRLYGTDQDDS